MVRSNSAGRVHHLMLALPETSHPLDLYLLLLYCFVSPTFFHALASSLLTIAAVTVEDVVAEMALHNPINFALGQPPFAIGEANFTVNLIAWTLQ